MESTLFFKGSDRQVHLNWLAPRRLAHLRRDLYIPVKKAMGPCYAKHFGDAPFAYRGGIPGTTAHLHRWCCALATCINSGAASPAMVALVLRFLEVPRPEDPSNNDAAAASARVSGAVSNP